MDGSFCRGDACVYIDVVLIIYEAVCLVVPIQEEFIMIFDGDVFLLEDDEVLLPFFVSTVEEVRIVFDAFEVPSQEFRCFLVIESRLPFDEVI